MSVSFPASRNYSSIEAQPMIMLFIRTQMKTYESVKDLDLIRTTLFAELLQCCPLFFSSEEVSWNNHIQSDRKLEQRREYCLCGTIRQAYCNLETRFVLSTKSKKKLQLFSNVDDDLLLIINFLCHFSKRNNIKYSHK